MGVKRTIQMSAPVEQYVMIGEAYRKFHMEKLAKGLVEKTLHDYRKSLEYFMSFSGFDDATNIQLINRALIIDWTNQMRTDDLSPNSINHYIGSLKSFLNWCMHDDRAYLPSFKIEKVNAQETPPKAFQKADINKLLEKPKRKTVIDFVEWRNWAIVNLIYDMGARAGSVVEIQIGDINLAKHTIYLRHTKNKALAYLKLSSQGVKAIKEYLNTYRSSNDVTNESPLFCTIDGRQMNYSALAHSFRDYCKSRGVRQTNLHGLRHSFATELAENTNGDMVRVQKALGHSSINMARKYVDITSINMGEYDDISPLSRTKRNGRGRPSRTIEANK